MDGRSTAGANVSRLRDASKSFIHLRFLVTGSEGGNFGWIGQAQTQQQILFALLLQGGAALRSFLPRLAVGGVVQLPQLRKRRNVLSDTPSLIPEFRILINGDAKTVT
jgi:hypothetical protein